MRQSYSRICGLEQITPCGSFQRQISDTVADISNSMLGPLDIKCICVALSNNVCIKELDLSGNDLSDKGAVYLAEALHENYTIDDLSVSECSISLDGLRDLCSILLEMKPMKRIDISKNNFGTQHVLLLAEVIKKNDYIEELVLSGNAIDNIGGTHIGKALMSNVGIKTLDLSWNHIRLQGAVSVCSALRFNQTLEDLDLSWNGLGEEGCKALGAALPLNHTLRQLDISSNRVSFQALLGLLPGLLRNDSLKLIRINSNPMTTDGAIAILKFLIKSDTSQLKDIHMSDIPINSEFLDALNELQKIRDIKVYHRYLNNKKITPIIRERTLHDHDPAMVLFEYMKQENIRLIDLFRTFDTDFSQALTKDELRDGFIKINMPLSDEALDTLFDRFDIDQNSQIEYSEVRSNYRKTISKMKYMTSVRHSDSENCFQKQLQNLVKKALAGKRTNYVLNAKKKLQRRISLTAIFKSANPNISFS
ncbi:leucine-rich repeat-containing protein 74B-like [Dreissena polymorpha]|nr:leucine-rich repeat-containing protein 74B-like [Dreissena polymorpha]